VTAIWVALIGVGGTILTLVGTVAGVRVSRLSERRLRLEAAMNAGRLLSPEGDTTLTVETAATALLSLADLGQQELSVVLLRELWPEKRKEWNASAILIVDKALRSRSASAQRLAAELLWYRALDLDARRATDWPSCIDGRWTRRGRVATRDRFLRWPRKSTEFGLLTRLFLFDAMLKMSLTQEVTRNALIAVTVRVYAVSERDRELRRVASEILGLLLEPIESEGVNPLLHADVLVAVEEVRRAATSPGGLNNLAGDPIGTAMTSRVLQIADWVASGQPVAEVGRPEDPKRFTEPVQPGDSPGPTTT
jgi:hypothetical protein